MFPGKKSYARPYQRENCRMSEHQSILYIIGVIVISLLIWLGFRVFLDAHIASQKDDFISAMSDIGVSARQYRSKPAVLGGGGGGYLGFRPPPHLSAIDAGTIFTVVERERIFLVGHSSRGYGSVSGIIEVDGRLQAVQTEGRFQ